ncbi:MAG: sensor histidine kinase [Planctomycetia bacterium]
MAYRSLRDILGETSLERKCRFLFGLCLFVLIAGSFWWYGKLTDRVVYETTRTTSRQLVDAYMWKYHWLKLEPRDEFSPGIKYLNQLFDTKAATAGPGAGGAGPMEALLKLAPTAEELAGTNRLDAAMVKEFLKSVPASDGPEAGVDARPEYREYDIADRAEYHYYQPIRARSECLICHYYQGSATGSEAAGDAPDRRRQAVGELMGVVKVVMPTKDRQAAINRNRAILLATAIMTMFLAMLAAYAIVRYVIVKPLADLRDVADEVCRGNTQARAEIHTADEFEDLGVAINRMLRGLIESQEELRKTNRALDEKVDELAQANLNLYEMNRLKGDFLATMSHELRTPLNSIIGFSDVLGSIQSLDDKQRRYVENIRTSGRMLLEMINDILDLAKIEAGKMDVRPATFRLEAVVSAQCDMVRPLAERKRIALSWEVAPEVGDVEQDQAKVQQILANLLSNAVKFTPEGGRVEVRGLPPPGADDGAEFLLEVIDTGVGIAEEEQQSIFEKFRQGGVIGRGEDAMTREYTGTGLGLSIVRELCRLLGGDVTLESPLGRGSRFVVRLPGRLPAGDAGAAAAGRLAEARGGA